MANRGHPARFGGWGRYPEVEGFELRSEDLPRISDGAVLPRGLGRSYGDSSLPPRGGHTVAASPLADRFLAFDAESGVVRVEAGLCLRRLNDASLHRGWTVPVSPGTEQVTLGGMVAADVHGKNHHRDGTFGNHVRSLKLRVADGRILEVSDESERDLFRATLGGMGLTGHILEVEFALGRIPSPWILAQTKPLDGVESLLDALRSSASDWPYTVGWVDCLGSGRALLIRGRWSAKERAPNRAPRRKKERSWPAPPVLPAFLVRLYNSYYRSRRARSGECIVSPFEFFYQLDGIRRWNRFYVRRGFTQYQCVVPEASGALRLFRLLRERRARPYLCVVKDCGAESVGMLSFPHPGISLALDFPIRKRTQALVDALNEVVIEEKGRVYLAKDAFTRAEHYRAMDPRVEAWLGVRRKWDPEIRLRSAQSVRLFGDPE